MILYFAERVVDAMQVRVGGSKRAEVLESLGLERVVGSSKIVTAQALAGPGGKPGTVLYPNEFPNVPGELMLRVKYAKDEQEWIPMRDGVWCGKYTADRVNPDELKRAAAPGGTKVRLGDGNLWDVAEAYYMDGSLALMRRLVWKDGATHFGPVIHEQAAFGESAGAFFQEWLASINEQRNPSYDFDRLIHLAVLGLQQNYRVGVDVAANLLGLFDEKNVWDACLATIGWPTIDRMIAEEEEAQKKKYDLSAATG